MPPIVISAARHKRNLPPVRVHWSSAISALLQNSASVCSSTFQEFLASAASVKDCKSNGWNSAFGAPGAALSGTRTARVSGALGSAVSGWNKALSSRYQSGRTSRDSFTTPDIRIPSAVGQSTRLYCLTSCQDQKEWPAS